MRYTPVQRIERHVQRITFGAPRLLVLAHTCHVKYFGGTLLQEFPSCIGVLFANEKFGAAKHVGPEPINPEQILVGQKRSRCPLNPEHFLQLGRRADLGNDQPSRAEVRG
jgi:hypothetical protein